MEALTPARPVSCAVQRAGLPASPAWPSYHSVHKHLTTLRRRFNTLPLSSTDFPLSSGSELRHLDAGSLSSPAESGSLSYGLVVHIQLLSTSSHDDAVTYCYRPENVYLKRTYTSLTTHACRRTSMPVGQKKLTTSAFIIPVS